MLLGLDGRLAASFWAVYPEEPAQRCYGSNGTLRADNVARYGHAE